MYYGSTCSTYCEASKTCKGNGSCTSQGKCDCKSGFLGDNCSPKEGESNNGVWIGVGIGLGVAAVAAVGIVIFFVKRRKAQYENIRE